MLGRCDGSLRSAVTRDAVALCIIGLVRKATRRAAALRDMRGTLAGALSHGEWYSALAVTTTEAPEAGSGQVGDVWVADALPGRGRPRVLPRGRLRAEELRAGLSKRAMLPIRSEHDVVEQRDPEELAGRFAVSAFAPCHASDSTFATRARIDSGRCSSTFRFLCAWHRWMNARWPKILVVADRIPLPPSITNTQA